MKTIHNLTFQNATKNECNLLLFKIPQKDVTKICRIGEYQKNQTLVLYKGWYYSDFDKFSTSVNKVISLENRVSEKTAKKFLEKIKKDHLKYSSVLNLEFYLIGTKLYQKYCKKSELGITETGNTLFGAWWSLWIEPKHNVNLTYKKFTRKNFEKALSKAEKWVKSHKKKIHFSSPKIQWYVEEIQ